MFTSKVTLTREELYEKVWTTPMHKLAVEFGFSGRGFAKLCRRHQIPVPARGYWARLQAGQSVKRTPLPSLTEARLNTVEICAHERQSSEQGADMEAQEIPTIVVAEDRPISHPITLRIEKSFSPSRKGERGLLVPKLEMTVPIQVSAEQLPRALRICDALLIALEQADYQLTWPKPYNAPLKVTVLEEPPTFLISEALERREHEVTCSRTSGQKLEPWWQRPRWDYVPTGCLRLTIEGCEQLGVRHSWSDGKKRRVEEVLGHFLVSLTEVAKARKRQREEQAEWERKWAEERKREAEPAARRAEYERRAKAVESLARSWDQSKSFRAYAEKLSSEAEQAGVPEEQKRDIRAMAEWVMRHAGFIDPFADLARMIRQFKEPPWSYGS